MHIAVTGASGFIGQNLCKYLSDQDHVVTALVRSKQKSTLFKDGSITTRVGDVRNIETLKAAFTDVDIVMHLAALFNRPKASWEEYQAVNISGTQNVMEAAISENVKQVIHCSTVGVAIDKGRLPSSEKTPYSPPIWDKYETSKCEGEKLALEYHDNQGLSVTVLRPAQVYGPGDRSKAKFYRLVKKGVIINPGYTMKHLIYIDDLCRAFDLAANRKNIGGEVFIIGGEEIISLKDLITVVAKELEVSIPRVYLPAIPVTWLCTFVEKVSGFIGIEPPVFRRSMDFFTRSVEFDISKAREKLGFQSKIDIATGVSRTAKWYVQNDLV
jgi:nucleoside-diphosphate-sugar epimerase